MDIVVVLLALIALVAAVVGLVKPDWALFFMQADKRSRPKAFGLYSIMFIACIFILPAIADTSGDDEGDVYVAQLQEEAKQAVKEFKIVKSSPEQIAADREEIRLLYTSLMQFKDEPEFHEKGFGIGLNYTNEWLEDVKRVDSRMSVKKGYPLALAASAGYLRQLGSEYIASKGHENQLTRDFRKFVEEGLAQQ